jgi:hypothetical protein
MHVLLLGERLKWEQKPGPRAQILGEPAQQLLLPQGLLQVGFQRLLAAAAGASAGVG